VTGNGAVLHRLTYDYDSFGNLIDRSTDYGAGASEILEIPGTVYLIAAMTVTAT
jgi:hypothetical protein